MYGWDSYFSVLGLLQSALAEGAPDLRHVARGIVDNLCYQVAHYGRVLNANRSYYLLRTQPPLLPDMALRVWHAQGPAPARDRPWLRKALRAALREYFGVWCAPPRRVCALGGLARYYGAGTGLPPETEPGHYAAALRRAARAPTADALALARDYDAGLWASPELDAHLLHDRAMRESGHDTSYRLAGRCAHLVTVDLNALLYKYECDVARMLDELGGPSGLHDLQDCDVCVGAVDCGGCAGEAEDDDDEEGIESDESVGVGVDGVGVDERGDCTEGATCAECAGFVDYAECAGLIDCAECAGLVDCANVPAQASTEPATDQTKSSHAHTQLHSHTNPCTHTQVHLPSHNHTQSHPSPPPHTHTHTHLRAEWWRGRAQQRKAAMNRWLWHEAAGCYYDYDFVTGQAVVYDSATAFFPVWAGAADAAQTERLLQGLLPKLELPGGLAAGSLASRGPLSPERPPRQWDYPFGWAPHQILFWHGLHASHPAVVRRLAYRWLYTILRAYTDYHGVVPEKFDVARRTHQLAQPVEYGNVGTRFEMLAGEGFAWTNASWVLGLALMGPRERRALGALIEPERLWP